MRVLKIFLSNSLAVSIFRIVFQFYSCPKRSKNIIGILVTELNSYIIPIFITVNSCQSDPSVDLIWLRVKTRVLKFLYFHFFFGISTMVHIPIVPISSKTRSIYQDSAKKIQAQGGLDPKSLTIKVWVLLARVYGSYLLEKY